MMESHPRRVPDYVAERLSAIEDIGRSWVNAAALLAVLMVGASLAI